MSHKLEITKTIYTCMDCKFHKIISDPDPNDWFNDDDVAVVCTLVNKTPEELEKTKNSLYQADKQTLKTITISCRPFENNLRIETPIPGWCPALKDENLKNQIL